MKILIDGDSCNTIKRTIRDAKEKNIAVHIYCDTKHFIYSDYAQVHIVDAGPDAADFAIANATEHGDVVLTNDGGLAAMVMARGGIPKRFNGARYTEDDVCFLLNNRHFRKEKFKQSNTKNLSSRHKRPKQKVLYVKECWC